MFSARLLRQIRISKGETIATSVLYGNYGLVAIQYLLNLLL